MIPYLKNIFVLVLVLTVPVIAQEIDLTPDASFIGSHETERVGYALCGGGDVNGDGYADFMVGTFHNFTYGKDAGAAYLVLGQAPFQAQMYDSLAWSGIRFLGETKYQAVGYSVANNGDLNGDGFDDLLIGAPAGNPRVHVPGTAYIVYGKAEPDWGKNFVLATSADGALHGEADWDRFGVSVAYVGDVNNDGLDDFLVGAADNDQVSNGSGKAYFFLGRETGWHLTDQALSEACATFICKREGANLGFAVAGVGDVNADGIPDFAIGAPGINKVYLMYGRPETDWQHNFDIEDNADVIFSGEHYNGDMNGYCVAAAGDVNGDQIADIVISAIHFRANGQLSGKVYIVFGRQGGWAGQGFSLANADASFLGELPGDFAGWSVASAGDVNGDGFSEVLIGMFNEENKKNVPGKAYLVTGKADYWQPNTELSSLPDFVGEQNYQLCGFCVAGAGDVDGDRWSDFLIAAPYYSPDSSGNVYFFRSNRPQAQISGNINYYQSHKSIPDVPLVLAGDFDFSGASDASGNFQFDVYQFADYRLTVSDLPPNVACLSAYDAALTARAALKLDSFSNEQRTAADVDGNGQVSVFDASLILRTELGLAAIPGNRAGNWHILSANQAFTNVQSDLTGQNIAMLVLGDVDASWQPAGEGLARRSASVDWETQVSPAEEVLIPINFMDNQNVLAFDLEMKYAPESLEFLGITTSELTKNFTVSHAETKSGVLRVGAFATEPQQAAGTYLEIRFKAKTGFAEKTVIQINKLEINNLVQAESQIILWNRNSDLQINSYCLKPNYPNPFNSGTRIEYQLVKKSQVELAVFNTVGQKICTLVNNLQERGEYKLNWDGNTDSGQTVPSGIYFIKMRAADFQQTRKITLLR